MPCMAGGVVSQSVDGFVESRTSSGAGFFSRYFPVAALVAVIAVIFHVTGSTGPWATANQSVLVLATLIAQISLPRRQLRHLLLAMHSPDRSVAFDPLIGD